MEPLSFVAINGDCWLFDLALVSLIDLVFLFGNEMIKIGIGLH